MFFAGISWFSVIVAAVAAFVAGWLWYSPWLFGKAYMKELGMVKNSTVGDGNSSMTKKFGVVFLGEIIMAIVAASLYKSLFIVSFSQLFILALSLWAAFVLVTKLNDVLFVGKSWKLFAITVGQDLLTILVVFIVVSLFS